MDNTIQIVLSSSLLVGIISAIIAYINNRKNNNLKYITEDRRKWREEIRNIVDELENTEYIERHKVLQKLKVRINPYGRMGDKVLQDYHIWNIISEMENTKRKKEYLEKKERLVIYLSFLLKYDWERTKKEVYGNWILFGLVGTIIAGLGFAIYQHFIALGLEFNDLFIVTVVFFLLFPIIGGLGIHNHIREEVFGKLENVTFREISKRSVKGIFYVGLCVGCLITLIHILQEYNVTVSYVTEGKGYFEMTYVAVIVVLLFSLTKNLTTQHINVKYCNTVKKYIKNDKTNYQ